MFVKVMPCCILDALCGLNVVGKSLLSAACCSNIVAARQAGPLHTHWAVTYNWDC
jgi:hypothetical protein